MHVALMKRIIFILITIFFLQMFFNDIYDHQYFGQKNCQKQKNIVFLKTHKVKKMLKQYIFIEVISVCKQLFTKYIFTFWGKI